MTNCWKWHRAVRQTWIEKQNVFKADVFIQIKPQFTDPSNQFGQSVLEVWNTNDTEDIDWHHVTRHLPSTSPSLLLPSTINTTITTTTINRKFTTGSLHYQLFVMPTSPTIGGERHYAVRSFAVRLSIRYHLFHVARYLRTLWRDFNKAWHCWIGFQDQIRTQRVIV